MVLCSGSMGMSCADANPVKVRKTARISSFMRVHSAQIEFERQRRKQARHEVAAAHERSILPLTNMPHQKRPSLDVAGAFAPLRFISHERPRRVGIIPQTSRERDAIFKSHAPALT